MPRACGGAPGRLRSSPGTSARIPRAADDEPAGRATRAKARRARPGVSRRIDGRQRSRRRRLRLQLIIALVVASKAAHAQVADEEPGKGDAKGSVAYYGDSDKTTVVTSVAEASVRLPPPVTVNGHVLVDAVSSASVDVISAATKRFDENRIEFGGNAQIGFAQSTEGSLGYTHSSENDWQSHALELGFSRDLAK